MLNLFFIILAIFLRGICILFMWDWFIVPFGVIPINYPWALGLGMLTSYLTMPISINDIFNKKSDLEMFKKSVLDSLRPAIILLIGYIIHLFM